jgi:transcriptional regulator
MFLPTTFNETRREVITDLMRAHPFATVIVQAAGNLAANHLPLQTDGDVLRGHIARGNELVALNGAPVLAIFHGPEGYISPNWYPSKHETGREVPTWNYAVVHVHGRLRVIDDAGWMRNFLRTLTDHHEASEPQPWFIDDAPSDYTEKLLRGVVGIEISIERLEAKFKLGQNKSTENRHGVIAGLQRRNCADDAALATLTHTTLSPDFSSSSKQ